MVKRKILLILALICIFGLTGCEFLNPEFYKSMPPEGIWDELPEEEWVVTKVGKWKYDEKRKQRYRELEQRHPKGWKRFPYQYEDGHIE